MKEMLRQVQHWLCYRMKLCLFFVNSYRPNFGSGQNRPHKQSICYVGVDDIWMGCEIFTMFLRGYEKFQSIS